jgi:hypothetical protein
MRLWSFALATGLLRVTTAVAQALNTGPAVDTLPPALKSCAEQMISVSKMNPARCGMTMTTSKTCMTVADILRTETDLPPGTEISCKWSKSTTVCGLTIYCRILFRS